MSATLVKIAEYAEELEGWATGRLSHDNNYPAPIWAQLDAAKCQALAALIQGLVALESLPSTVEMMTAPLPVLFCSACKRESVGSQWGQVCQMTQPNGAKCQGTFGWGE